MNIQWNKISIIIAVYYSVLILQSCCSCPVPDLSCFDYKSMEVETYGPFRSEVGSSLRLTIRPTKTYIGEAKAV